MDKDDGRNARGIAPLRGGTRGGRPASRRGDGRQPQDRLSHGGTRDRIDPVYEETSM
jgi:hypothetical protein